MATHRQDVNGAEQYATLALAEDYLQPREEAILVYNLARVAFERQNWKRSREHLVDLDRLLVDDLHLKERVQELRDALATRPISPRPTMSQNKHSKSSHTELLNGALFCHNCGKQVDGEGVVCFACKMVNPSASRFCSRCGTPLNVQYTPNPNISPLYGLDFGDIPTLPTQLMDAF